MTLFVIKWEGVMGSEMRKIKEILALKYFQINLFIAMLKKEIHQKLS